MSHDLFSDVSAPQVRYRTSSRWTMPISIAAHVVIVALVVIIPLMASDVLPTPLNRGLEFMPAAPIPPAPPAPRPVDARVAPQPVTTISHNVAPIAPPDKIGEEIPTAGPVADGGVDFTGATTGVVGSVDFGAGLPTVADPPPPPPTPPTRPVRVGGAVRAPVRIRQVPPIYPAIAQAAKIQGRVTIEATIDVDGSIRDLRVLDGSPLLRAAAVDAVRQWRYTPTLLNTQPVQVLMTVHVDFVLH